MQEIVLTILTPATNLLYVVFLIQLTYKMIGNAQCGKNCGKLNITFIDNG